MAEPKTQTCCTALADPPQLHAEFGPRVCGAVAAAPHPDPEKGYREPLCLRHLAAVVADHCTRCAFMQRTDTRAICPTHRPIVILPGPGSASAAFRAAAPRRLPTMDLIDTSQPRVW